MKTKQSDAMHEDAEGTQRARARPEPEAAAVWVPIDVLHPWKDNPRKNDGEPVRKVADSIRRFGFGAPILARRENGEIIAGHTRWKAAKKLGMDRVPVRYLDLDPAQAHLLAVADNRVAEEAKWDDAMLGAVLAELKNAGEELAATGMDEDELARLLGDATDAGDQSDDALASYAVIIECRDEAEQLRVIEWAQSEGLDVKAMV